MPQMFPLNWIILPALFIMFLLVMIMLISYNFLQPKSSSSKNTLVPYLLWTW